MVKVKIYDGNLVKYQKKTFDGTLVEGTKPIGLMQDLVDKAEVDGSMPGWELVNGDYRFETETVTVKLKKSASKSDEGED